MSQGRLSWPPAACGAEYCKRHCRSPGASRPLSLPANRG